MWNQLKSQFFPTYLLANKIYLGGIQNDTLCLCRQKHKSTTIFWNFSLDRNTVTLHKSLRAEEESFTNKSKSKNIVLGISLSRNRNTFYSSLSSPNISNKDKTPHCTLLVPRCLFTGSLLMHTECGGGHLQQSAGICWSYKSNHTVRNFSHQPSSLLTRRSHIANVN